MPTSSHLLSKKVAIIGAMEEEITLLRSKLSDAVTHHVAGLTLYEGYIYQRPILLMQCGIGKVNAAIGTTVLIDRFGASSVINTGSAGALQTELGIGDVVVANQVVHHDVDITAFGYQLGQVAQLPVAYQSDMQLNAYTQRAIQQLSGVEAHVMHGTIVSGDQFIHGGQQLDVLKQHFPDAIAVDMEAAAIAQTCYRFDVPFSIIRSISDAANSDADISFDVFLSKAAQHSSEIILSLLEHMISDI